MLKRYTITFRFTKRGEKKPGPVQRFVIYAEDSEDARNQVVRYANYPDIEVIDVMRT